MKTTGRTVKFAEWILAWRWAVIVGSMLVVVLCAFGASRLFFVNDYRIWFSDDNPQLHAFEALQNIYTKQDNIMFVIAPQDGNVFSPRTLSAVQELTKRAWKLPFALRVDSITNFQEIRGDGDDLNVEDLVVDPNNLSVEELTAIKETALSEPLLYRRLLAQDARVTAVNVTFQMPEKAPDEVSHAANAARALSTEIEQAYPELKTYLTGVVIMNTTFQEASAADSRSLIPAMFGVIFLIMLILLRSFWGMFATMLLVILTVSAAMGAAGWLGFPLTSAALAAPVIIMTLCVADSIHLLTTLFTNMVNGMSKRQALIDSIRINLHPIFLTSVTTAIGFLTMNFSDAPPFRDLGNITAIGVMVAFGLSVTFVPAVLSLLPLKPRRVLTSYSTWLSRLAEMVIARRSMLLAVIGVISLAVISLVPKMELNDQFVKYFDEDIPFRSDTDFTIQNLTGLYQVHFSLPTGESNGIANPEFLKQVEEFAQWIRMQPDVVYVNSITDVFKRLNKKFMGDRDTFYKLPEDRMLAAQYLLFYELSLPFGLDLNNQVNIDKSETQLLTILGDSSSKEIREFAAAAENKYKAITGNETVGIGTSVMFSHVSERNIKGMLLGVSIGLVVISMILIGALRSLRLGLISLIPNLLPAGIAFGLWSLFVGQVNMAVSVVAALTLGIVVDDTVHFLSKYVRARRERRLSAEDSVRYAFSSVGVALVVTTVILVTGFIVLGQSSFEINSAMAKLTAITITIALVIDFLLLPTLLMKLDRTAVESNAQTYANQEVQNYVRT